MNKLAAFAIGVIGGMIGERIYDKLTKNDIDERMKKEALTAKGFSALCKQHSK